MMNEYSPANIGIKPNLENIQYNINGKSIINIKSMVGGIGTGQQLLTIVFAKAGLDNVTSAMCKHQRWSGLTFNVQLLFLTSTLFFQLSICTGLEVK